MILQNEGCYSSLHTCKYYKEINVVIFFFNDLKIASNKAVSFLQYIGKPCT